MDWILFYGFCTPLLLVFIYKAMGVYRIYKDSLYQALFSNFVEFYLKFKHKKNLTESSWLKQEYGHHKLLFNSYLDQNQKVMQQFVTLFYAGGIHVFCICPCDGKLITTNSKGKWTFIKDNKKHSMVNPLLISDCHVNKIKAMIDYQDNIDITIMIPNHCDLQNNTDSQICKFKQLESCLTKDNILADAKINDLFTNCLGNLGV